MSRYLNTRFMDSHRHRQYCIAGLNSGVHINSCRTKNEHSISKRHRTHTNQYHILVYATHLATIHLFAFYATVGPVSGLNHGSVSTVLTDGGRVLKDWMGKSIGSEGPARPPKPSSFVVGRRPRLPSRPFCLFTKRSNMSSGSVKDTSSP